MVAQWAAMQAAVEMPEAEQEVVWAEAARVEAMMAVVIRAVERVADHTERVAKHTQGNRLGRGGFSWERGRGSCSRDFFRRLKSAPPAVALGRLVFWSQLHLACFGLSSY